MRYLGLALYAEGPTDYYFLRPVLQRLCEDLCACEAVEPVEVSAVLALNHPAAAGGAPRAQRILAAAEQARESWNILFVHADGANDPRRARQEQVEPGLALLRSAFSGEHFGVAVIPVRETEAWAIADGDAIRSVFGTRLGDVELGLAPRRNVESVVDPKVTLQKAFEAVQPSGQRRRQGTAPYLNTLGENASLECLRSLPAFTELERDLRAALQTLRLLR